MHKENRFNKKNTANYNEAFSWIIFFFAPVISALAAILNFKNRKTRKFIIMFGGIYGLFFTPITASDATRYQTYYKLHYDYSFNNYLKDILNIFSSDNQFPDIYAYTLFYVGNIFSNNPQFFHMLTGLVYFYVMVKLIATVYDLNPKILKHYYGVFFLGLVFIFPISAGINGVRWPLAFLVFMYGAINLIMQNKIKFLLFASLSILIHFSLYPLIFILLFYYYIPIFKKTNFLVYLILVSLFLATSLSFFIFDNIQLFGLVAESKLTDYTSEGYLDKRVTSSENWNFYVYFLRFGSYYFSCFALLIMWFKRKHIVTNNILNSLFNFTLLITAFSFLSASIFDLSTNRYILFVVFSTFFYLVYAGILNKKSRTIKFLSYAFFPLITFKILSIIRVDLPTVGVEVLINPLISYLFF